MLINEGFYVINNEDEFVKFIFTFLKIPLFVLTEPEQSINLLVGYPLHFDNWLTCTLYFLKGGDIMRKIAVGAAKVIGGGIASFIGWEAGASFFK